MCYALSDFGFRRMSCNGVTRPQTVGGRERGCALCCVWWLVALLVSIPFAPVYYSPEKSPEGRRVRGGTKPLFRWMANGNVSNNNTCDRAECGSGLPVFL